MIPPLLKLSFIQGPRNGESLEFKPGSTIRIGRIVRGNEIAIKDAGISTKHLRIVSDSESWIINDLGSSNGTILNSETLKPDTPVNLRHGDLIKLGECTSIVVNFETDIQVDEPKLPPRPRRNNRRLPVADPDPVPIESIQEKPTRKGRSAKQDEHEPPKRTRATRSKTLEDIADSEKEPEVENDKEVKSRVGRPRKNEKKVATTEEEEVPVEKKGNSRVPGGKKNTEVEAGQNSGWNSVKLEIEDTPNPKEVEISAMKRATRSKQIGNECLGLEKNAKSEDTVLEEMRRPSRATRSKKKEIGGDSFMELEMVLNQARKTRAKKNKTEQKQPESVVQEMQARNELVEENEKDVEAEKGSSETSDKEDETSKRVEQVEIESMKEDLNCSVGEDGETENLQDSPNDGERDCKSKEAVIETSDDEEKAEQESRNVDKEAVTETSDGGCDDEEKAEQESKNADKVDLEKMTLGEWFKYMEVQIPKQIIDETEKMIEDMRSRSRRVHQYIAEQKQANGKGSVS